MVCGGCGKHNATSMLERPIQVNLLVNFNYSILLDGILSVLVRMEHEMFFLLLTKLYRILGIGLECCEYRMCVCVRLFVSFQ